MRACCVAAGKEISSGPRTSALLGDDNRRGFLARGDFGLDLFGGEISRDPVWVFEASSFPL